MAALGDLVSTVITVVVVGLGAVGLAAFCIWFLFTALKALVTELTAALIVDPALAIGSALAKSRGSAKLSIDDRIADGAEVLKLRQLATAIDRHIPRPQLVATPSVVEYHSTLDFLPNRVLSSLGGEMVSEGNASDFFTVVRDGGSLESDEPALPLISDLAVLMRPAVGTVDAEIAEALQVERQYPGDPVDQPSPVGYPDLGPIPRSFDIPRPELDLPLATHGPMVALNPLVTRAHRAQIERVEAAWKQWDNAKADFDEALQGVRRNAIELKSRIEAANAQQRASWQAAHEVYSRGRRAWENRYNAERRFLLDTLEAWQTASKNDPVTLANMTVALAQLPDWLPRETTGEFDPETGVLIIEAQFPDVGQLTWRKVQGSNVKFATKAEAKDATERLYAALSLRLSWEVARSANEKLVRSVVLNGWADYVDRTTGETRRAYVSSLLAELSRLRKLNLPAVDVLQAFSALKGVTARAQTVTPVAPIVTLNTHDKRFVDARNVMDRMSAEQNLATMDWGDFEHLCRQLFEKEFAATGAEVRVTQASRDQGVDAVIFDPDPIRGGKIVVQAKRYAGTVDVSAVRDLWGTTQHEGAMKGILVTTSHYGSDAYTFANGKPITLLNGAQLLQVLEKHGYRFRIDLAEAKKLARERYAANGMDGRG